ncbi:MAG: hypothetical protein KIT12_02810 [Trueperaceae bacterium]|nr:hypothetical protein [Trueperaceae bacterium]
MSIAEAASPITPKTVVGTWLPLALSWIIMTSELVIAAAFVARMASPTWRPGGSCSRSR